VAFKSGLLVLPVPAVDVARAGLVAVTVGVLVTLLAEANSWQRSELCSDLFLTLESG
jgi:hypothetical protein